MKFSLALRQHQVAAWERYYCNYEASKKLLNMALQEARSQGIKLDTSALERQISSDVAISTQFFHNRLEFVQKKSKLFFHHYGFAEAPSDSSGLLAADLAELQDIVAFLEDIRNDSSELHSFCILNEESVLRICGKFMSANTVPAMYPAQDGSDWLKPLQQCKQQALAELDHLTGLINGIRRMIHDKRWQQNDEARSSLRLASVLALLQLRSPIDRSLLDALSQGSVADLSHLIQNEPEILKASRTKLQHFLQASVEFAILHHADACAKALLVQIMPVKQVPLDHSTINRTLRILAMRQGNSLQNDSTMLIETMIDQLQASRGEVLSAYDSLGRLPIHYGAFFGCKLLCSNVVPPTREIILAKDLQGLTPLHYALHAGQVDAAEHLLMNLCNGSYGFRDLDADSQLNVNELLLSVVKSPYAEVVKKLVLRYLQPHSCNSRGENVIHIFAELGHHDYLAGFLDKLHDEPLDLNTQEHIYGWTPLMLACRHGHVKAATTLIHADADQSLVDMFGWSAKEHATFRGHLLISRLFTQPLESDFGNGPAAMQFKSSRLPKHKSEPNQHHIVVNMGVCQAGKELMAIDLEDPRIMTGTLLEVTSSESDSRKYHFALPLLDDTIDRTLVFPLMHLSKARLIFKILKASPIHTNAPTIIGSAAAFLVDKRNSHGNRRESLIREQVISILDTKSSNVLGSLTFTFVISAPFAGLEGFRAVPNALSRPRMPQLIGHRGLGQNIKSHDNLQIGENTIESFILAHKMGAAMVEFDVQVTRDLVPVLYHDFSLSETGTDIPIHDVTIEQYMYVGDRQSPRGDPISVTGHITEVVSDRGVLRGKPRSRSVTRDRERGAEEISDRMKYTVDYMKKGFKPNTRGYCVQDSLATLEEALLHVPQEVGFNMEIKYPRIHEARDAGVAPVALDINTFIDTALTKISQHGGGRKIILSSFSPEVCILLSLKQTTYPVLFISNVGKPPMHDKELRGASIQSAVRFAEDWGLQGVVFASDAFVECPRLARWVKNKGLAVGTYGSYNNKPETAKMQIEAGVDLIFADNVRRIATALKKDFGIVGAA